MRDNREGRMRLVLAFRVAAVMTLVGAAPANGLCVLPSITVDRSSVIAGQSVRVSGEGFIAGSCDDVVPPDPPSSTSTTLPSTSTSVPREGTRQIAIRFEQGDRSALLTTVDADSQFRFAVDVRIPDDASSGAATISAFSPDVDVAVTASLAVTAAPTPPPTPTGDSELPRTGATSLFAMAIALVGIGSALMSSNSRRPRSA
jgi:hypothetical protein